MHSVGIHSALAIKRQRKRRDDQKKAKERRYSLQSTDSGETHSPSMAMWQKPYKIHHNKHSNNSHLDSKVVTSIGMLHIGIVFLVFGIFLVGAGFFPDSSTKPEGPSRWNFIGKGKWWNELICTGLFAVGLGGFLIVLNCIISRGLENDLENYVQAQLTRSRSGHRLERDVETGGLTTRQYRKAHEQQKVANQKGLDNLSVSIPITPTSSEIETPTTPIVMSASGEVLLERILEEDSYGDDVSKYNEQSPLSDNDKKLLLGNGHQGALHMTDI